MDIINYLIQKNNYKSYLEIGCQNDVCFNAIKVLAKVGVDPEKGGTWRGTSDDYFKLNSELTNPHIFDLVFVDGLHVSENVYRDIVNSLDCLNPGGTIVCHDMIPSSFEAQVVPRETKHWNGDCWKAFVRLRERDDLEMKTIQTDCGLGIIRRGHQEPLKLGKLTYEDFIENQQEWLNAISEEEFKQLY